MRRNVASSARSHLDVLRHCGCARALKRNGTRTGAYETMMRGPPRPLLCTRQLPAPRLFVRDAHIERMMALEPRVARYVQDRLRVARATTDQAVRDTDSAAPVHHAPDCQRVDVSHRSLKRSTSSCTKPWLLFSAANNDWRRAERAQRLRPSTLRTDAACCAQATRSTRVRRPRCAF